MNSNINGKAEILDIISTFDSQSYKTMTFQEMANHHYQIFLQTKKIIPYENPPELLDMFCEVILKDQLYPDPGFQPSADKKMGRYMPLFVYCNAASYISSVESIFRDVFDSPIPVELSLYDIISLFAKENVGVMGAVEILQAMAATGQHLGLLPSETMDCFRDCDLILHDMQIQSVLETQ